MDPKKAPISSSTQDFVEISDIINDILITKTGVFCLIIQTNSVNFDLLSEEEQQMKINAFGGLMNSLDFQMQIVIHTQKINISKYNEFLQTLDVPNLTPGLKRQFAIYKRFIKNLVTDKEILDKKFFIIIPYRTSTIFNQSTTQRQRRIMMEQAINYLYPKRNHVLRMLHSMGLEGWQLTNKDIIKHFYKIYNPKEEINIEGFKKEFIE